jgi:hypothetical protein
VSCCSSIFGSTNHWHCCLPSFDAPSASQCTSVCTSVTWMQGCIALFIEASNGDSLICVQARQAFNKVIPIEWRVQIPTPTAKITPGSPCTQPGSPLEQCGVLEVGNQSLSLLQPQALYRCIPVSCHSTHNSGFRGHRLCRRRRIKTPSYPLVWLLLFVLHPINEQVSNSPSPR